MTLDISAIRQRIAKSSAGMRPQLLSDLRALCDEVEKLRAQLTIPCPTCKAPATRISVPADLSPKEEGGK